MSEKKEVRNIANVTYSYNPDENVPEIKRSDCTQTKVAQFFINKDLIQKVNFQKVSSSDSFGPGDNIAYNLIVTNTGTVELSQIVILDRLNSGINGNVRYVINGSKYYIDSQEKGILREYNTQTTPILPTSQLKTDAQQMLDNVENILVDAGIFKTSIDEIILDAQIAKSAYKYTIENKDISPDTTAISNITTALKNDYPQTTYPKMTDTYITQISTDTYNQRLLAEENEIILERIINDTQTLYDKLVPISITKSDDVSDARLLTRAAQQHIKVGELVFESAQTCIENMTTSQQNTLTTAIDKAKVELDKAFQIAGSATGNPPSRGDYEDDLGSYIVKTSEDDNYEFYEIVINEPLEVDSTLIVRINARVKDTITDLDNPIVNIATQGNSAVDIATGDPLTSVEPLQPSEENIGDASVNKVYPKFAQIEAYKYVALLENSSEIAVPTYGARCGDDIVYKVVLINTGNSNAIDIEINDNLPKEITISQDNDNLKIKSIEVAGIDYDETTDLATNEDVVSVGNLIDSQQIVYSPIISPILKINNLTVPAQSKVIIRIYGTIECS